MNRRRFFVLVFFLLWTLPVAASDFIWPLQRNYGISSTFGESRDDHYHAGIDLSTNGETGLPVLAVADGLIYRMKIQKRAYGKALYIQHSNGIQSVYAHLEGYSSDLGLQKLYSNQSARMGTPYVGDIFVDPPIRVRQGEVVAFSGESGAGLPHLHLEIRKNETVIINPLTNGFQDVTDPVSPTFQACYFYPLTNDSAINGEVETKEVRFKKGKSSFLAESVPLVKGDFALSVSVYDSALRPYHRTPHKLIYSIDDQEVYSVEMDQFSYTEPQGFGLFYDQGKPGASYYEFPIFLTRLVNFPLPFVKRVLPFSVRTLSPGPHRLKIQAMDANNNTSIAEVPFTVNHPPAFEIVSLQTEFQELTIQARLKDPDWRGSGKLSGFAEYSVDGGKTFLPITLTSLEASDSEGALRFRYRIPMKDAGGARSVLFRGRAFDGVEYSPYVFGRIRPGVGAVSEAASRIPVGNFRFETYRGVIRVIFNPEEAVTEKLEVLIGDPPLKFPLEMQNLNSLIAHIPAPKQKGNLEIVLPGGQSLSIPVHYTKTGSASTVLNDNAVLSLNEKSLYGDTWIWTKSLPPYSSKSLPLIGPILQTGPRGLPFRKEATLTFSYPAGFKSPEKLSIYVWDRADQKWTSLVSRVDKNLRTVEANINYLDMYALIHDNVPPKITSIFPKRRSITSNQSPGLSAHIRDSGMDVDEDRITFFVDGTPYPAEYDPDRNVATAKITAVLKKGYHHFSAVAYDYAGNKSQFTPISFRVK